MIIFRCKNYLILIVFDTFIKTYLFIAIPKLVYSSLVFI